ncbi:uncharacterized protein [Cherax quadricarinatus]|uniref:uncharacterized protein n=1 Tax=Cherax quadricarinatus TaxID=27406 RepID=UPI00387E7C71
MGRTQPGADHSQPITNHRTHTQRSANHRMTNIQLNTNHRRTHAQPSPDHGKNHTHSITDPGTTHSHHRATHTQHGVDHRKTHTQPSSDLKTTYTQTIIDHKVGHTQPSLALRSGRRKASRPGQEVNHENFLNPLATVLRSVAPSLLQDKVPSTDEKRPQDGGGSDGGGSDGGGSDGGGSDGGNVNGRSDGGGSDGGNVNGRSDGGGSNSGGSDGGGSVDDVLAALVEFSRDPELWHFVHSVVDELDYSHRASSLSPGHRRRPALRLTRSHGRWWRTAPDNQNNTYKKWINGSESAKSDRVDDTGGGTEEDIVGDITNPPLPLVSPPHQQPSQMPSNEQENLVERKQQSENFNRSSVGSVLSHRDNNSLRNSSTRLPHFIFHKVYVDTTYNQHSRQPYHRPVLAVMAVSNERNPATAVTQDKGNELQDAMDIITYHVTSDGMKELPDKSSKFTVTRKNLSEISSEDLNADYTSGQTTPTDAREFWRKMSPRNHKHNQFAHKARKLHTFKSQIKFLQRWEDKLWKRSQDKSTLQPHKL